MSPDLPSLDVLVDAADAGLHSWVRTQVPAAERRPALAEELDFWLNTAATDLAYAREYAARAPYSGEPPAQYLDRWLPLGTGGHVLVGPRYLGRDPDLPFVGVSASDRVLGPADREALVAVAVEAFAAFDPGFVLLNAADPVGAWPGTSPEMRHVVGRVGDLRRRPLPAGLAAVARSDTDFYDRYVGIHEAHVQQDPAHARHARCETREDLQELVAHGLVFDVLVDGVWAGALAAEPGVRRGVRGMTVVELVLDLPFRGQGHGRHLSTLLARALPVPDETLLQGTVHYDNLPAYRSALAADRVDVGGEIVIPVRTR